MTEAAAAASSDDSRAKAASLIQRNYRGYRTRRELDGLTLSPDSRWDDALHHARLRTTERQARGDERNDASSRWKRGGVMVGQLAGGDEKKSGASGRDNKAVEGGPSIHPVNEDDDEGADGEKKSTTLQGEKSPDDTIGDTGPEAQSGDKINGVPRIAKPHQVGLRMLEAWTKGAEAQQLSKVMDAIYWLEMVDSKHRYGSNLKHYHAAWSKDNNTRDNFFKWLDHTEGKLLDLPECPRDRLEKERITYLSAEQRRNYVVDVHDGKLWWRRNGKPVDTTKGRWKDLGNGRGIVELGPEEQAEEARIRQERAARKGRPVKTDSSSSSSSSSDDEDNEGVKEAAHHYGGDQGKAKKGMSLFSTAGLTDKLLRKTVAVNTWIYVLNARHELYVGLKQTGRFQHSSFLYGSRVLSAGLLRAKDGVLTSLSPLSGHYRAGSTHFRYFVASLQKEGVDMSHVRLSKSLVLLVSMEQYAKIKGSAKGGAKKKETAAGTGAGEGEAEGKDKDKGKDKKDSHSTVNKLMGKLGLDSDKKKNNNA